MKASITSRWWGNTPATGNDDSLTHDNVVPIDAGQSLAELEDEYRNVEGQLIEADAMARRAAMAYNGKRRQYMLVRDRLTKHMAESFGAAVNWRVVPPEIEIPGRRPETQAYTGETP